MAHFIRIYLRPSVVNPAETLSAPAHNIRLHPHGLRPTRRARILRDTLRSLHDSGPPHRSPVLHRALMTDGLAPALAEKFHCPVGLDFGTNHPHEIALRIAPQLLTERDRRTQKRDHTRPRPRPTGRLLSLRITPSVLPPPSVHRSGLASS